MRIVQISDTHISRLRPSRADDLKKCIQAINALEPQPDVVVHTGDVAHEGHPEEYGIARELLSSLSAPCFVLPGNRDNRRELLNAFADGRHIRIGMDFVQYSVEHFDVRLILVDTVSSMSNKGRLCPVRLSQIDSMLAADARRRSVVFLHHPPFAVTAAPDPFQFEDWTDVERLNTVFGRYGGIMKVLCGHVHRDEEGVIGSVPARTVSCVATDLRMGKTAGSDLPIFSIYDLP